MSQVTVEADIDSVVIQAETTQVTVLAPQTLVSVTEQDNPVTVLTDAAIQVVEVYGEVSVLTEQPEPDVIEIAPVIEMSAAPAMAQRIVIGPDRPVVTEPTLWIGRAPGAPAGQTSLVIVEP